MPETDTEALARRCARLEMVLTVTIAELADADPAIRTRIQRAIRAKQPPVRSPVSASQTQYLKAIDALIGL